MVIVPHPAELKWCRDAVPTSKRSPNAVEAGGLTGGNIIFMSITIENPTAEQIIAAIKSQIPPSQFERMKTLLNTETPHWEDPTFSSEWSEED